MRFLCFLILMCCFQSLEAQDFERCFEPRTLRLDYIQAGNADQASYYFYCLKEEPLWSGSTVNLLDTFAYGHYFFEVRTLADSTLIYSRGFSTLFYEWQTTDEARRMSRAFNASLIMPFPKDVVTVELFERDSMLRFVKVFSHVVNPADPDIERNPVDKYQPVTISKSGKPENTLDIVFIPEGYTRADSAIMMAHAKQFADWLFDVEPFKSYRKNIGITLVPAFSEGRPTDFPHRNQWANTVVNSRFYTFGIDRYLTTADHWRVRDLAAYAPADQVVILVNTDEYGGGGIYNNLCILSAANSLSELVFTHEFGHSFGNLGDEYYSSAVAYNDYYPLHLEPVEPNLTTLVNFSSKWQSMLASGTPVPTPATPEYQNTVGVFEGGGYVAKGVYRPAQDCKMKSNQTNQFCPVCRASLEKMLGFYTK